MILWVCIGGLGVMYVRDDDGLDDGVGWARIRVDDAR